MSNAPTLRLRRAGRNTHGSQTYTFATYEGGYHILPANDEPGNPDRKDFEVYVDDGHGSPCLFVGTFPTLTDIREYYSAYIDAPEEEETEDMPEEETDATEDTVNRISVTVFGSHGGADWDCTAGRLFTCSRFPAFGDREETWSASAPGFGCGRDCATPEDAARSLARAQAVNVSRIVRTREVPHLDAIDRAAETVYTAGSAAWQFARCATDARKRAESLADRGDLDAARPHVARVRVFAGYAEEERQTARRATLALSHTAFQCGAAANLRRDLLSAVDASDSAHAEANAAHDAVSSPYRIATAEEYATVAHAAKVSQGRLGMFVDIATGSLTYFIARNRMSAFAMRGNCVCGLVTNAANPVKGVSRQVIDAAEAYGRACGFAWLVLDCLGDRLANLYTRGGFQETHRAAFDWTYAPAGWLASDGEPDLIYMQKPLPAHGV